MGSTPLSLDDVVQLRLWGSDRVHVLSAPDIVIGSGEACSIRIEEQLGYLSHQHARLSRRSNGWTLHDLGGGDDVLIDGVRRSESPIDPGVEISIGGLTWIAESRRGIALRALLCRMLGWSTPRAETVDLALRSVRLWAHRRVPLVETGHGPMVPIARSIHRQAFGDAAPFVLCHPRRKSATASTHLVESYQDAQAALSAAARGTLAVVADRLDAGLHGRLEESHAYYVRAAELIACESKPGPIRGMFRSWPHCLHTLKRWAEGLEVVERGIRWARDRGEEPLAAELEKRKTTFLLHWASTTRDCAGSSPAARTLTRAWAGTASRITTTTLYSAT